MASKVHTYVHPKTYQLWGLTETPRVDVKVILQRKCLNYKRCRKKAYPNFPDLTKAGPPKNTAAFWPP